uniref:Uncharacterized protein n=1 Tax=Pygocentrus nattereri TaxID=42514 RepID=A0AAR2LJ11_PYGNA
MNLSWHLEAGDTIRGLDPSSAVSLSALIGSANTQSAAPDTLPPLPKTQPSPCRPLGHVLPNDN